MGFFSPEHETTPSVPGTPFGQERILLIDDDKLHRTCLKELLEYQGYACLEAINGVKGLEAL